MKWKKATAALLAVSVAVGMMSGCGSSSQTTGNGTEASQTTQETAAAQETAQTDQAEAATAEEGDGSDAFDP